MNKLVLLDHRVDQSFLIRRKGGHLEQVRSFLNELLKKIALEFELFLLVFRVVGLNERECTSSLLGCYIKANMMWSGALAREGLCSLANSCKAGERVVASSCLPM